MSCYFPKEFFRKIRICPKSWLLWGLLFSLPWRSWELTWNSLLCTMMAFSWPLCCSLKLALSYSSKTSSVLRAALHYWTEYIACLHLGKLLRVAYSAQVLRKFSILVLSHLLPTLYTCEYCPEENKTQELAAVFPLGRVAYVVYGSGHECRHPWILTKSPDSTMWKNCKWRSV